MKFLKHPAEYKINFHFLIIILFMTISLNYAQNIYSESTALNEDSSFTMTKSASLAMLQSALLPGLGQFYNESYWKIPVVWGFIGYYLSVWIEQNDKYNYFKKEYLNSINTLNPDGDIKLKSFRNFYHNQRDEFTIYLFITYLLNVVDAYVDAHLFDFNINPEINNMKLTIRLKL